MAVLVLLVSLIAEVGCMGFHMFLVPPCHSWCRYGSSLCVPWGGWVRRPAPVRWRHGGAPVEGGTSFRAHIPTLLSIPIPAVTLVGSLQGLPFRACRRVIETCENIRKDIYVGIDVPFLGVIERLGCQISAAALWGADRHICGRIGESLCYGDDNHFFSTLTAGSTIEGRDEGGGWWYVNPDSPRCALVTRLSGRSQPPWPWRVQILNLNV